MHEFQTPEAIQARLSLLVANVTIEASDRATTTVELAPTDPGDPRDVEMVARTEVGYEDGMVTIRSPRSGLLLSSKPRGSIEVAVQLPTGSSIRAEAATGALRTSGALDVCRLDTAAGDVAVERSRTLRVNKAAGSVTIGEVTEDATIDSATGAIRIGRIGGGAKIDTANGDIRVGSADGDVKVSGANGDIVIERCGGSVKANTAFGSVRLLSIAEGKVKVDSARGDIEIGIEAGTAAWLDLDTTFGNTHSELGSADAPEHSERTVEVRASTAFGNITVRRAQPWADGELTAIEA